MASGKAAWGIEVGAYAIKAIRLERDGDEVRVSDFAVIPHKKVLSTPDLDQDEMVRLGLGQFISQKALENEIMVMSVPGHSAFARFAKLPPVEPKKVPDIVKFEAVQQIPFPIDQVEWDYEVFRSDDSPEVEVGIFAITRDRVQQRLALYGELGINPEALTLSPVALYNAMAFDHELKERKGTLIYLDIGTNATDLVIADEGRCWIRTFPLGGTHFTDAIASAFKLSYSKAEKLKQETATSKYAKQIMQAMRPVFSDLLQDVQRSIGYYQSLHRDRDLSTLIGLGSTFKIPGLRKFLGQQLQIEVLRLDEYKKIRVEGREAAAFAENAVNMATAYGLALQGVGLAPIEANLVPVNTLREQMWAGKTKWFAAAAAILIVGAGMTFWRPLTDRAKLDPAGVPASVTRVLSQGNALKSQFTQAQSELNVGFEAENVRRLVDYRNIWPHLVNDAATALASTDPQAVLLTGSPEAIRAVPVAERRLVQLERLDGNYVYDAAKQSRRIKVTMEVQLSHRDPTDFLHSTVVKWLRDNRERPGVPYRIINESIVASASSIREISVGGSDVGTLAGRPTPPPPQGGGAGRTPPPENFGAPSPADSGTSTQGGPVPGRRTPAAPGSRTPPGAGSGAGMGDGSSSGGPGSGASPSAREPRRSEGSNQPQGQGHQNLHEMAPVPAAPQFFPEGSRYYVVPITFEIELLNVLKQAEPAPVAGGSSSQETAS